MEFRVDRQALAEGVAWAVRTVPSRPALPVLAGLLIEADADGRVVLAGFDHEVSARAVVDADVARPGRALVPGRLLTEIVRSLPARPVEIAEAGSEIVVRCGSAEFGIQLMPVEDYPALPEPPAAAGTISADAFAAAVAQVAPAAGRDDTLPMLTGVRLDFDGPVLRMACTDRYRIAAREVEWKPVEPGFSAGVVVPARTLADTAKAIRPGAEVEIGLAGQGATLIGVSGGDRSMTTRLLDDQFIDYRSRLTGTWSSIARVETGPFTEAIKRVALVADRGTPVRLAFTDGRVRVRAAAGDAARANETIDARLDGDDIDIAFSPQYLLDGLAGVPGRYARLECTTPTKAALLTGIPDPEGDAEPDEDADTGFRYLVMPIRLAS
ncbi:DNA polymerase III subunit beta [Actinomadura atramentaria]|uniref:DNA polymerase III subunit beta n=1 Tax=Actinomadura atramentaria TaxID=1990 RepID=UPI000476ED09|nr:DNA polymerase III subunit beta [Actinomadura atramentaria]